MNETRMARLAGQLRQEIATIIHQELKDPGLGFVTITRIELSKDGKYAKVLFSCLGGEEERVRSQQVLNRSAGYMHALIKKRFRLKVIPEISFRYDPSIEGSVTLSDTFDQLKQDEQGRGPTRS